MFAKLRRRIVTSIFAATAAFLVALGLLAAAVIGRGDLADFRANVAETARIGVAYSAVKLDTIRADAVKLAVDETVLAALAQPGYVNAVNPKLNFFRSQYQEEVAGLTLYAENGRVYKTDSLPVAAVLPQADLLADPAVAAFVAGTEAAAVVILRTAGATPTVRSFALLVRIGPAEAPLGLLFVDVDPDYMFRTFFTFADHPGFTPVAAYVTIGEAVLHPSPARIDTLHRDLAGGSGFLAGTVYGLSTELYQEDVVLWIAVDASPLVLTVLRLVLVLALTDAFLLSAAYLAARRYADFIALRLMTLQERLARATARIG